MVILGMRVSVLRGGRGVKLTGRKFNALLPSTEPLAWWGRQPQLSWRSSPGDRTKT